MKFKRLSLYIVFICVISVLLITPAFPATYYVKNGGNDSDNGLSDGKAWKTIGKVNSVNFANGDIIQFKRGDTFNDADLTLNAITSPATKTITIQNYGAGTLPWVCGNSRKATIDNVGLSIVVKDIKIDGQGSAYYKFYFGALKNITIDGVTGDGSVDYNNSDASALFIFAPTGDVEIKNCTLIYWGGNASLWGSPATPEGTGVDRHGIAMQWADEGTHSIHDNDIQNCEADCIQIEDSHTLSIYDNTLWNAGENSVDIKGTNNVLIHGNTMGRDATFVGSGGSSTGVTTLSVVHVMDRIDPGTGSNNVSIYNNLIGPTDMSNLKFTKSHGKTSTNIKFYDNYCKEAKYHVYCSLGGASGVEIYNNIFAGLKDGGLFYWEYFPTQPIANEIYNNTFYVDTDYTSPTNNALVNILGSNSIWENNIFQVNDATDVIIYVRSDSNPSFKGNRYNNANQTPAELIDWKGSRYSVTDIDLWIAAGHKEAEFTNEKNPPPPPPPTEETLEPPAGVMILLK